MVKQRPQLGDRNRYVCLQRIRTEEIVKQAANRAFLVGRTRHMPWRAEGILTFVDVGKQRLGEGRRNIIKVFIGVLADTRRDIVRLAQRIFEEPQRHAHVMRANVHRRVVIDKSVKRQIFIELIYLTAEIDAVLVPVKNDPANARVVLNKLQQVGTVLRPDDFEALRQQRPFQFLDRLVFVVDAVRPHNGDNIHAFLLEILYLS